MTRDARLWIITRKHPPAVGGMEELSRQVVGQLLRRRPATVISWGHSQLWLPAFLVGASVALLSGIVRGRVAVLLLGDPVLAMLGWLASRLGVPVVCIVHGLDVTWRNSVYQGYLRAFFWRRLSGYVCISQHTAELVLARGTTPDRVFVVPVGVAVCDAVTAAKVDGDPVLLFVGRLVTRKGAAWFVRTVLPSLVQTFPALRLLVVGIGPEWRNIEAAAKEHGVAERVTLIGAVGDDEKWSLLVRCDAVVVPNVPVEGDVEGFGIVALEAGAAGRPVFAADLEGLRDAVAEGVNGWRLPAGDAAAWTDALTARLGDRGHLRAQGERAREHVRRNFDWDAIGERYAAIVERFVPPR